MPIFASMRSLIIVFYLLLASSVALKIGWNSVIPTLQKVSFSVIASAIIGSPLASYADVEYKTYSNERYQTTFKYPASWEEKGGQLSGDRSLTAFINPTDSDTSISVVYTPIPADYTTINSFGGKDSIRQYVLPKAEGIETKVIDERVKGDSYFLEYVISSPDAPKRHIQSIFSLRPQESVVGFTAQTKEETFEGVKDIFSEIEKSFVVNK